MNKEKPQVNFTGIQVLNRPYRELEKSITYLKEITLSYKDYVFSFDFASTDYSDPEKVKYKYILEGFDNDWVELGNNVDSDEASFKMAGARAFMDAFLKAGPVLLEPVMELVTAGPTESAGAIFSDLTSHRRGQVIDQWNEGAGAITVIKALAPLSTVQTYQRDLKSQTAGEGSFTMAFHDYAQVPANEQQKLLAQIGKKHGEEE